MRPPSRTRVETSRRRGAQLFAVASILVACSSAAVTPRDAGPPPPDTNTHVGLEIGTRESGAVFTPWHDGDTIPLQWGAQGGVMVTPAIAIDGALLSGDAPMLDVSLQNVLLPSEMPLESFPGYGPAHVVFARLDTRLVNGPILDQVGWSDMPGQRLRLRAHVTGSGIDAIGQVDVTLGSTGSAPMDGGLSDGVEAGTR